MRSFSFKALTLSGIVALSSFVAIFNTQCMLIKNSKIKAIIVKPKYYSSEKPNDPLTLFNKIPSTVKVKKNERLRKVSRVIAFRLVDRTLQEVVMDMEAEEMIWQNTSADRIDDLIDALKLIRAQQDQKSRDLSNKEIAGILCACIGFYVWFISVSESNESKSMRHSQ